MPVGSAQPDTVPHTVIAPPAPAPTSPSPPAPTGAPAPVKDKPPPPPKPQNKGHKDLAAIKARLRQQLEARAALYEASYEGSASTEDGSSIASGFDEEQAMQADIAMHQLLLEVWDASSWQRLYVAMQSVFAKHPCKTAA